MTNPASTTDVEARWRPLTPSETTTAAVRLDDAWSVLRYRVPDLEARVTAATVDVQLVVKILCDMVLRVLDPPKRSEQIGNYAYTMATPDQSGLYVTDDEVEQVSAAGVSSAAFTIRQVAEPACVDPWGNVTTPPVSGYWPWY